ncbi:MAG TPA: cytochrome c peroxidase [Candidatus Acidoferrales bacterium]|nr:cytochrome c peroxidase [Candidatus Acidoferrales bacterium]
MKRNAVFAALIVLALPAALALAQGPPPPPPPLTPLPPPLQPAGNPATTSKVNLGKTLFWDEQLSSARTVACGTCHRAASGGSDPRAQLGSAHSTNPGPDDLTPSADDITGSPGSVLHDATGALQWSSTFGLGVQVTGRYPPSNVNAAYDPLLFWDGRAGQVFLDPVSGDTVLTAGGALENQVLAPPVSTVEMGHIGRTWTDVASQVATAQPLALATHVPSDLTSWIAGRSYADLFVEAFGSVEVTGARIAMAIASYERTLFSTQTPFDSLIAGTATLTPLETQGFQLFGQLPCAGCHAASLMSDNQYHYTGVRPATDDSGRAVVTHAVQDLGAFKTPSLRNVSLRTAFMHDGRFSTLSDVIDFYDRGGDFTAPNKDPRIVPLHLTPQQKAALLAFLGRPLVDARVAAASAPFDRPTLYSEGSLTPEVLVGGVNGSSGAPPQPVALEPALLGNPTFTLGLTDALGGASAVLVIDDAEPPASGGIPTSGSFARIPTVLGGSGASAGYGSATLAVPSDPSQLGRVLYARWYVSDPAAPGGIASSPAVRITLFGPDGSVGTLGVLPGAGGGRVMHLYASQPNPFPVSTTVRFDLYERGSAKLTIFDVGGRAVRRLFDRANAPAGSYSLAWDGRDDAGRTVAGGVYFERLVTARDAQTTRVVRVP